MALRRYQHKFLQPLEIDQERVASSQNTNLTTTNLTVTNSTVSTQTVSKLSTNNFFNSATPDYTPSYETLTVFGDPTVTQGAIAHIRNNNVSVNDANVFGGLKFSSSPGADFIIGKSTQSGSGFLQIRRENGTTLVSMDGSGNFTLNSGNLVIGTSGKGIDFSATANSSGTMTSELFNDYEYGIWTPTYTGGATYTTSRAFYIKIGRQVTCYLTASIGTPSAASFSATLPFASDTTTPTGSFTGMEGMGTVMLNSPSTPTNGTQITAYAWNSILNFYWTFTNGGWSQATGAQIGSGSFVTVFTYIATT